MRSDSFNYRIADLNKLKPQKGNLLVAEPFMGDPYFKRSVVLMSEHHEEGTVGFILNKPLDININQALDHFPELDAPIFLGGPVQPQNLFFVHTLGDLIDESLMINDDLYWGGDFDALKDLAEKGRISSKDIRFFLGYAGWEPGQLDQEMSSESWLIAPADYRAVMRTQTDNLWRDVLISMGKEQALLANFPEDPSYN